MDKPENKKPAEIVPPDIPDGSESKEQEAAAALEQSPSISKTIQSLLKSPDSVGARIGEGDFGTLIRNLILVCIACCLGYGLIAGSFSGGAQWYASPVKILVGLFLTSIFCLPSLYIFACMSGADIRLGQVTVALMAANTLMMVLLIGLGPVTWVFSQSTNSVFFMGLLHLIFWLVSFSFGMNLILKLTNHLKPKDMTYLRIWIFIFLLTSVQMMTALRPLIGTSEHLFPKEKKFFIKHWIDTAGSNGEHEDKPSRQD